MTLVDISERTAGAADLPGIQPAAAQVLREARDGGAAGSVVVVQGAGGTGKTFLMSALAAAYRRAGVPVVTVSAHASGKGRSAEGADDLPDDLAVLVDDAHLLDAEQLRRAREAADRPGARLVVACRPSPRRPPGPSTLAQLVGDRHGRRRAVTLRHLDADSVAEWAGSVLGGTDRSVAAAVHAQTGGLPSLVSALFRAYAEAPRRGRTPGVTCTVQGSTVRLPVPVDRVERIRGDLLALDGGAQDVLQALASGAPADAELLGELLDVEEHEAAGWLADGRATGYVLPDGTVVPLVARVLLGSCTSDSTTAMRRRLLAVILDRGEDPLHLARALAGGGQRDRRAAAVLERSGTAALTTDPVLAGTLLDEALVCGGPAARTAGRRAQAAAAAGNFDAALRLADAALHDPVLDDEPTERARAGAVAAAVLAARGLLERAADLFGRCGQDRAGSTAVALVAVGRAAEARAVLDTAASAAEPPGVQAWSEQLMAEGVLQSLRTGPRAADDIAAALSSLTRASAILEPVGRTALLGDTPAAVAALVALHCGELGVAESVLRRALAADLGGPSLRPRHLLLLAWVAMLRGQMSLARTHMSRAVEGRTLEPRDELFRAALEVGLARRASDLAGLVRAWAPAREVLLRYPVELFALLPLGELLVAGARLKDDAWLAPHLTRAQDLLGSLGDPLLWATSLHWSGAQAAILTDNPAALEPHATALVTAARTSPFAATLAQAGRVWLRVLRNDVDEQAVVTAAERLGGVGLAWDGSRLAGQAAVRAADPHTRTALKQCARSLTETRGPGDGAEPAAPADPSAIPAAPTSALSEREREVARLVVAGQTYREIGGKLFISAKTVEHHVSRMRQRLGAGNRSELLARLRAELADSA